MRRTRLSMKKFKASAVVVNNYDSSNDAAIDYEENPEIASKEDVKIDECNLSESSGESDIESYIKPTNDLNFPSFEPKQDTSASEPNFEAIEAHIFSGINRLSETDSETETTQFQIGINHFRDVQLYNAKIDDAKKSIEKYESQKQSRSISLDVNNILAAGEKIVESQKKFTDSNEFESDEQEDWEEIKNESIVDNQQMENAIKDVEITVEIPGRIAKNKGIDLITSIKRRINRVKKEQQIYIHKVHLLCWIAHGNYVNKVLNQESLQAIALSLLPSQHCYPSSRVDLEYLDQILTWYQKRIKIVESKSDKKPFPLDMSLQHQMDIKETYDANGYVFIFICILRSIGINVRLVMNLLVEPFRPPSSELCSLSNKPVSETKNPKQGAEVKSSKSENTSAISIPSTSRTNDKPGITMASKLRKLTNCTDDKTISSATKSKSSTSEDKSRNGSKRILPTASKRDCDPDRGNRTVNPTRKSKDSSKNNHEAKEDKAEIAATKSQKLSTSFKIEKESKDESVLKKHSSKQKLKKSEAPMKFTTNKNTKDTNSKIIHAKEDETKQCPSKRLSEVSVNNFPSKKSSPFEKHAPTYKQYRPHSPPECVIIDLTADRGKKLSENNLIKGTLTSNANKLKIKESPKNVSKRAAISLNTDKNNRRNIKKSKDSVNQVDGPNDYSDESDHRDDDHVIPQLDSNNSESERKRKPNLRKLKTQSQSDKNQTRETYKKGSNESLKALLKSNEQSTKSIFSSSQSSYFSSPDKKTEKREESVDIRNDIINLVKTSIRRENQKRKSNKQRKSKSAGSQIDSDSDSDFVPVSCEKKKPRNDSLAPTTKVKRRVLPRKELNRHVDSDENEKKKRGIDIWVEIFLEAEEKWISVDVLKREVHCIKEIYGRASHPICYILSWDNSNYIKDVTQRYCSTNWNTVTRKQRVEPEWWLTTLKPFEEPNTARKREEDEELEQQQMDQPLPKVISEYKNHPLYALKRHLLKFEAIYPADAPTLGFVRKQPVYSRLCVHTLHSREIWVKHAKVVKPGETPYKIVKARPKYDRSSNTFITDKPLEIFGIWQVDDYVPPTAKNGIVPKNAYGNVELFKKCMLPKGTVHLELPGLQKVARKLNIDCAPAVVGFDFHGGWSHPTFEGFVVCEEFADTLMAAWDQEQEEAEKREAEKIHKRIYGNWRRLIMGLLIRERLQKRYDFAKSSTSENKKSTLVLKKESYVQQQ